VSKLYRDCKHGQLARQCPHCENETMESEIETLRAQVAALEARLREAGEQVPVAYMHNKRADVIHTSVKSLLSDFAVNSGPESMLRPIDKSEHYTIPLYAAPVPAQPAADVAAIAMAVRDIPSRIESLGGQRFAYVKLSEVIDTIYSVAGKQPAVPEAVAKDAEAVAYLTELCERIDKHHHVLMSGGSAKLLATFIRAILSATDTEGRKDDSA